MSIMHHTIYNTPVLNSVLRGISFLFIKLLGWKTIGPLPTASKYIIIVAPHTSNWDLFYGSILAFALNLDANFMAKKELFRWPFGVLMKWLGGVPINRASSGDTVEQVVRKFNEKERFILAIAPEGTRRKVNYWKSGFYHIAEGARVPILLGFIDYARKTGGAGPLITPTGDIDHDMQTISKFYSQITGKYDDKKSPVAISHKT
jgi:1-acyl-sn-glycerol-3-phosphate acyltransferase